MVIKEYAIIRGIFHGRVDTMGGNLSIGGYTLIVVLLIMLWVISASAPYDIYM